MSIFYRVNPHTATSEEIHAAIEEFVTWKWEVAYSFAHIVLDDKNIDDGDIQFCLQQHRVDEWVKQQLRDNYGKSIHDPEELEEWERDYYEDVMEMRDEIIIFLRWLLNTREEERDKAWDKYYGVGN